jgi:aldehyde dehydrogenase (NAD+)
MNNEISRVVEQQRCFFLSQQTKPVEWRKEQLNRLKHAIITYEQRLLDALWTDLHKSAEEAFLTEISIVLQEIKHHLRYLDRWAAPRKVGTTLSVMPSKSRIIYEPLGMALIIAPWNYPFQLLINPLIGAISAGCCAVLKPSPYTPAVSNVIKEMIENTFPAEYIAVFEGNRDVNQQLLAERFDMLFFTGSPQFGRIVMQAAAKNLTPVVLELGGKSPCIVDRDANLKVAARRIMWGKTINAGQTCIAPDYLFVHADVKQELFREMRLSLQSFYGNTPKESPCYSRIVNRQAVERLQAFMHEGEIVFGGEVDLEERYIAPTLIDNVEPHFAVMQEEIFGPILPALTFHNLAEVERYINSHPKPLALYYFGADATAQTLLAATSSGGVCLNDTLMHIANPHLPFGGVGNSGMGKYHHHRSFLAFSNERAVMKSVTWFDLAAKFPPYKGLKKLARWLR